jgi:hypothetical protein
MAASTQIFKCLKKMSCFQQNVNENLNNNRRSAFSNKLFNPTIRYFIWRLPIKFLSSALILIKIIDCFIEINFSASAEIYLEKKIVLILSVGLL